MRVRGVLALALVAMTVAGCGGVELQPLDAPLTVTLDPASPPDPASSMVALLVTEAACNSGEPATGRIEARVVLKAATVEVEVGIRPRGGDQECPGNPPTPFLIDLGEPLGDRMLLDASVEPPRPIRAPGNPS